MPVSAKSLFRTSANYTPRLGRAGGLVLALAVTGAVALPAQGLTIVPDYRYDTNLFFDETTADGMAARAALEAVAARFSAIITTNLGAVSLVDDSTDARIGFTHPGTGADWEVSSAASADSDRLTDFAVDDANEYRGAWSIAEGEWILYAGGRSLSSAGVGGTGTGTNFSGPTGVFEDEDSVINRGFRAVSDSGDLPVWGGTISFDNDGGVAWNFDHTTASPSGTTDFYTIALHEVGHALGLSTGWDDWEAHSAGGVFSGPKAVGAYNTDNGTSVTGLNEVSGANHHFEDGTYDATIYSPGNPQLAGTDGLGVLTDLLMEPTANFDPTTRRYELTTVDVGALEDIGWDVIVSVPEPASAGMLLVGAGMISLRRKSG